MHILLCLLKNKGIAHPCKSSWYPKLNFRSYYPSATSKSNKHINQS